MAIRAVTAQQIRLAEVIGMVRTTTFKAMGTWAFAELRRVCAKRNRVQYWVGRSWFFVNAPVFTCKSKTC